MNNKEQKVETSTEPAIVGNTVLGGDSKQLFCPKCGSDDIGDDVKDEKAKYCFSCKSWFRAK